MKKVLLLFGGNSSEHYISCLSAASIVKNIDKNKYQLTIIGIYEKDWYLYEDDISLIENGEWMKAINITKIFNVIDFISKYDVIFPIIHGKNGEDGKLQGMLELFDLKYIGCNQLTSAICMDKEIAKIMFEKLEIPVIPYICIKYPKYNLKQILKALNFPMIIKPANGGSSIGISIANNKNELIKSIEIAKKYDKKIIIEKYIKAREIECAVIEGKKLHISSLGEIKPANQFYDYNSKYENNESKTIIPTKIPKNIEKSIKQYTKKAFIEIGLTGFARVDFFYDDNNNKIYINEINTIPGFTNISMFPNLLIYDNISYKKLITHLIENANR